MTTHIMVINGLSEFRKLGYSTVLTIMAPKQQLQVGIRHARHNCDKKQSFRKHVEELCKRANQRLHTLARLSAYIDPIKLEILMNSFINSQFKYCPFVWMFHDRVLNSKLNFIQKRALRLVWKSSEKGHEKVMNKTLTTHQHNLQLLMIEIYKTKHSLNPTFIKDIFIERINQYNLRNENHLQLPVANPAKYRLENIEYRGCLCFYGQHYRNKLKTPTLYMSSKGK